MNEHILPFSTEVEQYLLSCIIVNDNALDVALDIIGAEDFYWPNHEKLFRRMVELHGENKVVDLATLSAEGEDTDLLHHLLEVPAVSARTADYARQMRDLAIRRRVMQVGTRIVDVAAGNPDANEVMDEAEAALFSARGREQGDAPSDIALTLDVVEGTLNRHETRFGLRTHIDDLNDIIVGMSAGTFNILAARTGQGKTCLALDITRHVSWETKVLFFSVEMTKREIAERLVAAEGSVALTSLRTGTMGGEAEEMAHAAIASLRKRRLVVDDSSTTMYDVQRKVRRVASRGDLGLVVVDYIQLLTMGERMKTESRQFEVAQISRSLKLMAREYNIPVLGVSQLSRPERQYDGARTVAPRPNLASLRDSGALEQDADLVFFIYRKDEASHEAELLVQKNRQGPTGTCTVHFWPQYTTFRQVGVGPSAPAPLPYKDEEEDPFISSLPV